GDTNFTTCIETQTQNVHATCIESSLAPSLSPSVSGQSVTFTATVSVTAPGAGSPTGTVTFKDGAATLGTGTLSTSAGVTTASFPTSTLSTASHSITVSSVGGSNFNPTSGSLTQVVNPAATTTSLS